MSEQRAGPGKPGRRPAGGAEGGFRGILTLLAGLLLAFTGLPLLLLLPEVSVAALGEQLRRGELIGAVAVSAATASVATAAAALLGVPLGYRIARGTGRWPGLARAVVLLPTVLPPVAAGVLLLNVYGPGGPVGRWLVEAGIGVVNAPGGIVAAQIFVAAPFVALTAEAAFRAVDPLLEEASSTLGAGRSRTFFRVSLPLARNGVLAGLALAWMRALGEFGATAVLAFHPRSLPVLLWVELTGRGLRAALPVALVALVLAGSGLALAARLLRGGSRARSRRPLRGPARPPSPAAPDPGPRTAADGGLRAELRYDRGEFTLDVRLAAGGEILALFGPSGAGKTTVLRLLAGLARPDAGEVELGGRPCLRVSGEGGRILDLPPSRRPVGLVFQRDTLFPHLTVERNILYGLDGAEAARAGLLSEMVAVTRLSGLEGRYPDELSGGQRQRAALARSLVRRPRVLLLDEPFSSLDANMREALHEDVRRIQRTYGLCIVYVTHELRDACTLADRLAVLVEGRIEQTGPPLEVLRRPASFDVARFVAVRNLLPGTADGKGGAVLAAGRLRVGAGTEGLGEGTAVWVCVRPEDVEVRLPGSAAGGRPPDRFSAVLEGRRLRGATETLSLRLRGIDGAGPGLEAELPAREAEAIRPAADGRVEVRLPPAALHAVPRTR